MKKLLFSAITLLAILVVLTGCNRDKVKVGFLMDNVVQERWERDRALFVEKVQEFGGEVEVLIADNEAVKQYTQAEKLIQEGVDVLVVVPVDLNAAAKIVELAKENEVKVISYDRIIKNADLDFYVSFDHVDVGRLQAEYLTTVCPVGNYVLINGPTSDNNTFLLELGQLNVLQPLVERGDISIVYNQFAEHWSQDEGYRLMKECLSQCKQEIHAVIADNDALARGAILALEENGLTGTICVAGMDAETDACQRILEGTQTMTIYKPIEAIATTAAKIALQFGRGEELNDIRLTVNNGKKLVPSILLPSMVVNRENIRLTVVADGYLEENQIYQ
ncbi:MAG: substrate-binding domain-containing protein [Bacteroidota bacterium]